jgi:hypothetical protein
MSADWIDKLAIDFARRVQARQLRCDYTIAQLPAYSGGTPQDPLPIYNLNTGQTYGIPLSDVSTIISASNYEYVFNANYGYGFSVNGTGAANTTALQNAINACAAAGGGIVIIQTGTYQLAGGVTVPTTAPICIRGGVFGQTVLVQNNSADTFTVTNGDSADAQFQNLHIKYATTSLAGNGFTMKNCHNIEFSYCRVESATNGWYIFDCGQVYLFKCSTAGKSNATSGVFIDGGNPSDSSNSSILVSLLECQINGSSAGSGVILGICQTITFTSTTFLGWVDAVDVGNQLVLTNPDRGTNGIPAGSPGTGSGQWSGAGGASPQGPLTQLISFVSCNFNQGTVLNAVYLHPPTYQYGGTGTKYPWYISDFRFTDCLMEGTKGFFSTVDTTATYPGAPASSYGFTGAINIENCSASFNSGYGMHFQVGVGITIVGGIACANTTAGIFLDGVTASNAAWTLTNVAISGVKFGRRVDNGGSQNTGIVIDGSPNLIEIAGCDLSSHINYGISITGSPTNILVSGCSLMNNASGAIYMNNTPQGVTFVGCLLMGEASSYAPLVVGGAFVATGSNIAIYSCPGYNDQSPNIYPSGVGVSSATSGYYYNATIGGATAPWLGPWVVYVSGSGGVVSTAGTSTHLSTGTFYLQPAQSISQASPTGGLWVGIGE